MKKEEDYEMISVELWHGGGCRYEEDEVIRKIADYYIEYYSTVHEFHDVKKYNVDYVGYADTSDTHATLFFTRWEWEDYQYKELDKKIEARYQERGWEKTALGWSKMIKVDKEE